MLRYRIRASHLVPFTALALAIAAGCSNDSTNTNDDLTASAPRNDDKKTPTESGVDSGNTTPPIETTDRDAEAPEKTGCALVPNADFCDDFDSADALTAGKTKWDFVEQSDQPVATLSSDRAVSAPSSLLSQIIDGTTPGAKFAKTITKSNFTEATWDYDVYFENPGQNDGYFLDDFQFVEGDTFGFRIVAFAKDGAIDFARVEHNADAVGGRYDLGDHLPEGTISLGKWMHFTQTVKFTFAEDAGTVGNKASYSLAIDGTPVWTKDYAGATRAQTAFARIAGLALVFRKDLSAGLKINWDNQVLVLK